MQMAVTLAWWLNVAGLVLNTLAAALMFFFPPMIGQYTEKGEGVVTWVSSATEEGKRKGVRQRRWSKTALIVLGLGFSLQLMSALLQR
jgi:hypothetical protein